MPTEKDYSALIRLHQLASRRLNMEELRTLCFRLGFDYENLPPQGKVDVTRELIVRMNRCGRLAAFVEKLRQLRPDLQVELEKLFPTDVPTSGPITVERDFAPQRPPARAAQNPFGNRGRIEDPRDYLVRQPLTQHVFEELRRAVSLSIVGASQSGKSSLLWYLVQRGPEHLGRPAEDFIYFNMELVRHEDDFFENLCAELGLPYLRGMKLGRRLRGRRIVLCLDEVERMNYAGFGYELRSELRGLSDGVTAPFTLVIASRSPLGRLFPDSPELTSPLAGICKQEKMPNFTPAECRALVAQKLQGTGWQLPEDEIERAWRQTQGHPGRLQDALRIVFGQLYQGV